MSKWILQTERLNLKPLDPNHSTQLYHLNLDPEVIKYTGDIAFNSEEEAKVFLANYDQFEKYGMGRFACHLKHSDVFLGWCGLRKNISLPEESQVDLGFRFFRKYWNQGFATESSLAIIKYGFDVLKLQYLIAKCREENLASSKVIRKLGFTEWKRTQEMQLSYIYFRMKNITV